jgi:uncharacterized protein YcbK (DUF882 family)
MKLSANFFIQEFKALPNNPTHVHNYTMLCHFGLEHIRKKFGGPVVITSGYRDHDYNLAVGGSPTSQHVSAEACDFLIKHADSKKIYDFVCDVLKWPGQCFWYSKRGHVHIGLPSVDLLPTKKVITT